MPLATPGSNRRRDVPPAATAEASLPPTQAPGPVPGLARGPPHGAPDRAVIGDRVATEQSPEPSRDSSAIQKRSPVVPNRYPNASNSSRIQPAPSPRSSRPRRSRSIDATTRARSAGWRNALQRTRVPSRTRCVTAAIPARVVSGSSDAIGAGCAVPRERVVEVIGHPDGVEPQVLCSLRLGCDGGERVSPDRTEGHVVGQGVSPTPRIRRG